MADSRIVLKVNLPSNFLQRVDGTLREVDLAAEDFRIGDQIELSDGWCEITDMYHFQENDGDTIDAVVWLFADEAAVIAQPRDSHNARLRVR